MEKGGKKGREEPEGGGRGEWQQEISCGTGLGPHSCDKTDSLRHLPQTVITTQNPL